MKKTLLLMLAAIITAGNVHADDLYYGIYKGTGSITGIGTGKAEAYDVAMHLNDPALVGMEIRAIRVPVNMSATNTSGYSAWLSTELAVEKNVNVPNVTSIAFEPTAAWNEVTLAEPVVIPEGGIYVGYSFSVGSVSSDDASDPNRKPVQTVASDDIGSLYIHAARTFRKWTELSRSTLAGQGAYALTVVLGGERVLTHAASIVAPDELSAYALVGQQQTLTYTIVNHGTADITGIDYELSFDGQTVERHATVNLRGTYFGRQTAMRIAIPAATEPGTRPITVNITKLNGEPNQDPQPAAAINLACLAELPPHKPLLEEYTGTWCQYCTRGMAAMEALNRLHGDEFVGVAYHTGDSMQVYSEAVLPNSPSGYPHAYIDRVVDTDPFFGTSGSSLGINSDWAARKAIVAPAKLGLSAQWTDDSHTAVELTASATFIRDFSNNPFRFSYIIIGDDISGQGEGWNQHNAYAGSSANANDPYLGAFTRMPAVIEGYKFQEVAMAISSAGQSSIAESLPEQVEGNVAYTHSYTFDLSSNRLRTKTDKLHAVAVLINTTTGEVANSEKATVGQTSAVTAPAAHVTTVAYTDLSGRTVTSLGQGIYIRTTHYADGTTTSTKVANKQ